MTKPPASTKSLFRAIKAKSEGPETAHLFPSLPTQKSGPDLRDPLDYDPTPADATAALLRVEGDRIRKITNRIWEPAVGGGHIARELDRQGFETVGNDVVDRGHPGTIVRSFYDYTAPLAPAIVTNPPYGEISARDGHGRWLRHTMTIGVQYCAMLLGWEWMAGRINGMDALHQEFPCSRVYLCCWKIDFRGKGSPPQRNAWHIWDNAHQGETILRRLFREGPDPDQRSLI